MRIIGLTGGIAMGKSTAAAAFRRAKVPVFDADATVHRLQARGGAAVAAIGRAFPETTHNSCIDRTVLRRVVLGHSDRLHRLEAILHPLVRAEGQRFLARQRRRGAWLVVLDIPLLFETGGEQYVDQVVVATAPRAVQMSRLRRRRVMSDVQIAAVIARQMPDQQKRRAADGLIHTGLSRYYAQRDVRRLIAGCR